MNIDEYFLKSEEQKIESDEHYFNWWTFSEFDEQKKFKNLKKKNAKKWETNKESRKEK